MNNNSRPRLWTASFIRICSAHFIMTVGFHASMPVFPLFLEDRFSLAGILMGMVLACYTVSAILFRLPVGYCLDRFGRKGIYLSGYFLFSLAYLLYPMADSATTVALARFCHGALWGVVMGAANTAAVDLLPPERRGEGIGYFGLTMVLGLSVGPALGTSVAKWLGYDAMFSATTVFSMLGFVLVCPLRLPQIPCRKQPLALDSFLEKTTLPVSLATLIFCIPFSSFTVFATLYARALPDASPGLFFFCLALGTGVTRLFSGQRFDRTGPGSLIYYGYTFSILGCLLMACAQGPVMFTLGGLCAGLGNGITLPLFQAMTNSLVPPQRRGAANATMMTAFDVGIGLGLLGISHCQTHFGWSATYALLTVCVVGSALVFRFAALPRYLATRHY